MKPFCRMLILFAVLFLLICPVGVRAERTNRALLVGCDRFISMNDTTPASASNVTRMAEVLSGGAQEPEVLITRRGDIASVDSLRELVQEAFSDADEDDVSYFYLSTHGFSDMDSGAEGTAFLLSNGTSEERLMAGQLREILDMVSGTKVLILDTCHSGAVIGKGVETEYTNLFLGSDYKVICSAGGLEESWFFMTGGDTPIGAGYFSNALSLGLSASGAFSADSNSDGEVTLTELKKFLRRYHGASTVHTYPEEDDFVVFSYDPASVRNLYRKAFAVGFSLDDSSLADDNPSALLSFTAMRTSRLTYQLIYRENEEWRFDDPDSFADKAEPENGYGIVSQGTKERLLTLRRESETEGGYALLQVLAETEDGLQLLYSPLLCVPPLTGEAYPAAETCKEIFTPSIGEEMPIVIRHVVPCSLSVTIADSTGENVIRLASRQATRPEQLSIPGSTFYWNGMTDDGEVAKPGWYQVRCTAYVGGEKSDCASDWFFLSEGGGIGNG